MPPTGTGLLRRRRPPAASAALCSPWRLQRRHRRPWGSACAPSAPQAVERRSPGSGATGRARAPAASAAAARRRCTGRDVVGDHVGAHDARRLGALEDRGDRARSGARLRLVGIGTQLAAGSWRTWKKPRSRAIALGERLRRAGERLPRVVALGGRLDLLGEPRRCRRSMIGRRAAPPSWGSGGRACRRRRRPRGRPRRRPTPRPCVGEHLARGVEDAAAVALGVGAQGRGARRSHGRRAYTEPE